MDKIHPRASCQARNPQFGIPHTARESVQCKRTIEAKETSPLLPESPSINTPTCSSDTLGLISVPEYISSPSSELGEKRRDSNAVINIHNECEETSSSNNTAALSLPIPFPAAHSLPPLSPLQFVDGPRPTGSEVVPIRRNLNVVSTCGNKDEECSSPAFYACSHLSPDEAPLPAEVVPR